MTERKQQQQQNIRDGLENLRRLRDEIRLDIHLAGMEARERWQKLEPLVFDAERLAGEVGDAARRAVDELAEHFRTFREHVRAHTESGRRPGA